MPAARPARPVRAPAPSASRPAASTSSGSGRRGKPEGPKPEGPKPEAEILFQQYFKSVNPARTYAAQVKRAGNGNHFLVLTEGKRDEKTGEVRKTRLYVFSEDFVELFRLLHDTAQFIKANPVPENVRQKRHGFWAKQANGGGLPGRRDGRAPARPPSRPGAVASPPQTSDRDQKARPTAPPPSAAPARDH